MAVGIDPEQPLEARAEVQHEMQTLHECCLGFAATDLRDKMPDTAIARYGVWGPYWDKTTYEGVDTLDASTQSTEALHAAQQKLLLGGAGGGSGFISFTSKCTNRLASTEFPTGVMRNSVHTSGSSQAMSDQVAPVEKRGGTAAAYHVVHSEVCRELKTKVNDAGAHVETNDADALPVRRTDGAVFQKREG